MSCIEIEERSILVGAGGQIICGGDGKVTRCSRDYTNTPAWEGINKTFYHEQSYSPQPWGVWITFGW